MKPIIILFLLLFGAMLNAQVTQPSEGFTDYVLFKNGSEVYGKILYYAPNDTLELQIAGGRIVRFEAKTIKKVVMTKPKIEKISVPTPRLEKPYNFKERGFYGSAAYAMSFGRNRNGGGAHIGVGLQASAGYLLRRQLGFGGGLAYDSYYLKDGEANVYAVFGEVRGYLSKRNVAEYYTFAAGYGQPTVQKDNLSITKRSGGLMIQPTFGLRFGASARYNFFAEVGARFQRVHYGFSNQWLENDYKVTYQRWILRGGIVF
jgi:hypothetical protein